MIVSKSRRLLAVVLLFIAAGLFMSAGRFITDEDPLEKADAIYVLGGTWATRPLESVDLYKEGYAPHIVMSPGSQDTGEVVLARRGNPIPRDVDYMIGLMVDKMGVPAGAVELLPGDVDNTAQEAEMIESTVKARGWRSLIVITDRASTRRAAYAMRRVLGPDIHIIMRASRYDYYAPGKWWKNRQTFRMTFYEVPKLLAYVLGLRG